MRYSMRFHRRCRCSATRLWQAITDPSEASRWIGRRTRIDLRPGGEWHVDPGPGGEEGLSGTIVRIVPGRSLAIVLDDVVIDWAIEPSALGCDYRVVHHGREGHRDDTGDGLGAHWIAMVTRLNSHIDSVQEGAGTRDGRAEPCLAAADRAYDVG